MFRCAWCDKEIERAWEIPRKPSEDRSAQYVCKRCHTGYFNDELDSAGRTTGKGDRVI